MSGLYSFFIFLSMLSGFLYIWIRLKVNKLPTWPVEEGVFFLIPIGLIGARIGWWFSNLNKTSSFWEGGMSFFFGMIFASIVAGWWFWFVAKKLQISIWVWSDIFLNGIILAQVIGRLANVVNQEILGANIADDSWLKNRWWFLRYKDDPEHVIRHPIHLYELSLCLVIFLWLHLVKPFNLSHKNMYHSTNTNELKNIINQHIPDQLYNFKRCFQKNFWKQKQESNLYLKSFFYNCNAKNFYYAGLSSSFYFISYGIIRVLLEPLRDSRDQMLINGYLISYWLAWCFIIMGIVCYICSQIIAPTWLRRIGYTYEIDY